MRSIAIVFALLLSLFYSALRAAPVSPYTTVNANPQLGADESFFSFYWAVWRALTPEEQTALVATGGGSLLSERNISWDLIDCRGNHPINHDGERFWFLDTLRFGLDGKLIPIREAYRPGYRYLNMVTINSVHLTGRLFAAPQQLPGEPLADYREREATAYAKWMAGVSTRGTRGSITVQAVHRLFDNRLIVRNGDFVNWGDYRRPASPLAGVFEKFRPDRWPVFYDERAHKPHALTPPAGWATEKPLTETHFALRLDWNWCRAAGPGEYVVHVPAGGLPPGGPTRPGRPDAGTEEIHIVEDL